MSALAALADTLRIANSEFKQQRNSPLRYGGYTTAVTQGIASVDGLPGDATIGNVVRFENGVFGEIVKLDGRRAQISPFANNSGIKIGDVAYLDDLGLPRPNDTWLGRSIDSLGRPLDGLGPLLGSVETEFVPLEETDTSPLKRQAISEPIKTGVKAIDIFTPLCKGQRMGIFAGSGVGKSTLLSMLAKSDAFDAVVVALVGERTREVREFLEETLDEKARAHTIAVVATSDESPILRRRAPELALDICEALSAGGKNVLLLIDSLTRYAHALREIGVASGEPPVARGYPSSVFSALPRLLERAGMGRDGHGSITAIPTVLVDGDDHNDPVADSVRGIIDGHLVLDRTIAEEGRYPPINPLSSVSRLSNKAWSSEERDLVLQLRKMISLFEETKDLRMLGGGHAGADPKLDKAVATVPVIYEAISQMPDAPLSENAFADLVGYLKGEQGEADNG